MTKEDVHKHFPLAQVAAPWDVVLEPGELLLVPAGMPFEVSYWEKTVGLSGKFADDSCWGDLQREHGRLAKSNNSSGIFRAARLAAGNTRSGT